MMDIYMYFYSINYSTNAKDEEYLLDCNEIIEMDNSLNFLPNVSPSDSVVNKILELV